MTVLKKFILIFFFILTFSFFSFGSYINSVSAGINAWNNSDTNQALSLINISLSSTLNVENASKIWYFKSMLELMDGKTADASASLKNAVSVFGPAINYNLMNSLISASFTSFVPVVSLKKSDSIDGIYNGNEIFYSPVCATAREGNFYVLDAANGNVIKFGKNESTYHLGIDSTPTAMIYSALDERFYVSFQNGCIYSYSSAFKDRKIFESSLSFPVIFCQDDAGRIYVGEYGKDEIDIFENNGTSFRKFNLFSNKIHIFSYGHTRGGIFYLMNLTDREVMRFDIISGKELTPVPFPSGPLPYDFEILGDNLLFFNSSQMISGGINFNLEGSRAVFYSYLTGKTILTADPVTDRVNIYDLSLGGNMIFPIIDSVSFANGKISVYFRILSTLGRNMEYLPDVIVKVNGFLVPFYIFYVQQKTEFYRFPSFSDILSMNKNVHNIAIVNEKQLDDLSKYYGTLILRNVALYVIGDPQDVSEKNRMMVYLTGGTFISQSEIDDIQEIAENGHFKSMMASFPIPLSLNGINDISVYYGAQSNMIDTVYYTDQNVLSK